MPNSPHPIARRHASGMTLHKKLPSYINLVDFGLVVAEELISGWASTRIIDAAREANDNSSLLTDILHAVGEKLYGIVDLEECHIVMDDEKNISKVFVNTNIVAKTIEGAGPLPTKKQTSECMKHMKYLVKDKMVAEPNLEKGTIILWSSMPLPKVDRFWGLFEDDLKSQIIQNFKGRIEKMLNKARPVPAPIVAA